MFSFAECPPFYCIDTKKIDGKNSVALVKSWLRFSFFSHRVYVHLESWTYTVDAICTRSLHKCRFSFEIDSYLLLSSTQIWLCLYKNTTRKAKTCRAAIFLTTVWRLYLFVKSVIIILLKQKSRIASFSVIRLCSIWCWEFSLPSLKLWHSIASKTIFWMHWSILWLLSQTLYVLSFESALKV